MDFSKPFYLTEGAVGTRLVSEFGLQGDPQTGFGAMIYSEKGRQALETVYSQYLNIAAQYHLPILLLTNTRRCNSQRLKDGALCRDYAAFLQRLIKASGAQGYAGAMLGCKNDAYRGDQGLDYETALAFHRIQMDWFKDAPVDFFMAAIMPSLPETLAMAALMAQSGKPYLISFMVEETGHLPDGTELNAAIAAIDSHAQPQPLGYICNCVHPRTLIKALAAPFNQTALVKKRFLGLQGNGALLDRHALDGSGKHHTSEPEQWANDMEALKALVHVKILGGCCGTTQKHIEAIAKKNLVE